MFPVDRFPIGGFRNIACRHHDPEVTPLGSRNQACHLGHLYPFFRLIAPGFKRGAQSDIRVNRAARRDPIAARGVPAAVLPLAAEGETFKVRIEFRDEVRRALFKTQ